MKNSVKKFLICLLVGLSVLAPAFTYAAIAFDASSGTTIVSASSVTWSHTCTGSDRILFVATYGNSGFTEFTGITYNGVSLTFIASEQYGERASLWYLINPASGTHDIVISAPTSRPMGGSASSYTGARQSGGLDASITNLTTGSPITTTLTTVADNSWTVVGATANWSGLTAGSGSTVRNTQNSGSLGIFDSNGPKTPAGSTSMTLSAGNNYMATVMVSFAPAPPPVVAAVQALVVAGGGGGGGNYGGGGGAGGVIYNNSYTVTAQAYTVTVGAGGTGGNQGVVQATNGGNSVFNDQIAIGGGNGGGYGSANGGNGGSGGGGGYSGGTGGTHTAGQGFDGGADGGTAPKYPNGGGGGAGAAGVTPANGSANSGNGGDGISNSITGSPVIYAGGGGGGGNSDGAAAGSGGAGGGGAGSTGAGNNGTDGTANTGGGGGGHWATGSTGNPHAGNGGSGIVIIAYPTGTLTATGGTITTSGGNTIHTFTSSGTFTVSSIAIIPTVTSPTATSVTSSGATLGANVISNGGSTITSRGTCWGTSAAPVTHCIAEGGTTTGIFTQVRTGLPISTLIYYRGYAVNSAGTGYSADGTFTTGSATPVTVDWNNSNVQELILSADRSFTFTNGKNGGVYTLLLKQDATGGRLVAWPSNVKWEGGATHTFTSAANGVDLIDFLFDGTNYLEKGLKLDIK